MLDFWDLSLAVWACLGCGCLQDGGLCVCNVLRASAWLSHRSRFSGALSAHSRTFASLKTDTWGGSFFFFLKSKKERKKTTTKNKKTKKHRRKGQGEKLEKEQSQQASQRAQLLMIVERGKTLSSEVGRGWNWPGWLQADRVECGVSVVLRGECRVCVQPELVLPLHSVHRSLL